MPLKFEAGKLPNNILKNLLQQFNVTQDSAVVIPPSVGMDAAGLKVGDRLLAMTTDPITFTSKKIAKYAVRVNINDVACLGCRPMWFMSVLLLPPEISETELYELWSDLVAELRYYNIVAIGGHSEITAAVNTPVIVGYMVGEAVNDHFLDSRNIQPGDSILLWRGAAIEGTALLAAERFDDLKAHILPEQLETMKHLLDDPGICIWPAAKKLFSLPGLVAMHDPTEGGVATAIHELADIANCGVEINANSVPILSETLQLAKILEFDPLGLLASGSLLVVCKTESVDAVLGQLKGERVAKIGEFTKDMGRNMVRQDQYETLPRFDQDEIIKALKKKI